MVDKVLIDILCIDEKKLDDTFPDAQFKINNYQYLPFRRDRNSKGGGKIVYIRQGLISKRLSKFESNGIETICIEFTISKKKWCILFGYRPPNLDKNTFFSEISNNLSLIINEYENVIVAGDLNIDLSNTKTLSENHVSDLRDIYICSYKLS